MRVAAATVVSFRFVMYDVDGNVLQDTTSGNATRYLHGGTTIAESLQKQIEGMRSGDVAQVHLSDQTGEFSFTLFIDSIRPAIESELKLGYPIDVGDVCDADCECYIKE